MQPQQQIAAVIVVSRAFTWGLVTTSSLATAGAQTLEISGIGESRHGVLAARSSLSALGHVAFVEPPEQRMMNS